MKRLHVALFQCEAEVTDHRSAERCQNSRPSTEPDIHFYTIDCVVINMIVCLILTLLQIVAEVEPESNSMLMTLTLTLTGTDRCGCD